MCFPLNSITKKQLVAVTGLALILFVIMHLAGNLFIFGGPDMFNAYSKKLHALGLLLWVARIGLILAFVTHIYFTYLLVLENIKARGGVSRYAVNANVGRRNWATRIMPYTGTFLYAYIVWHVFDFTLVDQHGMKAVIDGVNYGLYGVVVNSLSNPLNAVFYIAAMFSLGFHLLHGIQSVMQTFGFNHPIWTPFIKRTGFFLSVAIAAGFSSIPLFILFALAR
jgi:succinate dehydrogenase / fumarate reductase cytochrome b subunit